MSPRDLAILWLRDRAATLRGAAARAEQAYSVGDLADACTLVGAKYRKAAELLADAALELEHGGSLKVSDHG